MIMNCPICQSDSPTLFFKKSGIPVQDGLLYDTREKARFAPTGLIQLMFCMACGFIWNQSFESDKIRYDDAYEISLSGSAYYRNFLSETAERLATRYLTTQSHVVEIGCGDGSFLQHVCSAGNCEGVGYDPTYKKKRIEGETSDGISKVQFVSSFFPDNESLKHCDLICCRHVLQQVLNPSNPAKFLEKIHTQVADNSKVHLYFEVPNGSFIFRPENIWNIVYEYHSYFTADSLCNLFQSIGFSVLEVLPCFQSGQYLGLEAKVANGDIDKRNSEQNGTYEQLKNFQTYYHESLSNWQKQIATMIHSFKRIAAWGAGGRAISFFSALGIQEQIPLAVDINVHRQGKFLPVTGQKVVPPEFLLEYNPDAVLITNPSYEKEIRNQISELGLSPSIFVF